MPGLSWHLALLGAALLHRRSLLGERRGCRAGPVDYAVRAHIALRGLFGYRYADPVLDAWIGEVDRVLMNHRERAALRRERLTPEELALWDAEENDAF